MRVINGFDEPCTGIDRSTLAIGNFDGVHLGHRRILDRARQLARRHDASAVAVTFEPHPLSVVAPAKTPPRLTPRDEKIARLAEAGIDAVLLLRAEPALLALTAEEFIERLVGCLRPTHVVEGPSFGFGRGRSGSTTTLRDLGEKHGFDVSIVEPLSVDFDSGERVEVSSSVIRGLIISGSVEHADVCLGRPYGLLGRVVAGAGRGRKLGLPTANLQVSGQLIPADGVYAGYAFVTLPGDPSARRWPAAISVGSTPTFERSDAEDPPRHIEAHLLDIEAELYDLSIRLDFGRWLRPQRKFANPDQLIAQIHKDLDLTRDYASSRRTPTASRGNAGDRDEPDHSG